MSPDRQQRTHTISAGAVDHHRSRLRVGERTIQSVCIFLRQVSGAADRDADEIHSQGLNQARLFDIRGQPTEADLRAAAAAGYKTVINLRPSSELPDIEESG